MAFDFGQLIGNVLGGIMDGSKNFNAGLDYMGDFDPESFVNSNLKAAQREEGGIKFKDVTQYIGGLLGSNKRPVEGTLLQQRAARSPLTDSWIRDVSGGGM